MYINKIDIDSNPLEFTDNQIVEVSVPYVTNWAKQFKYILGMNYSDDVSFKELSQEVSHNSDVGMVNLSDRSELINGYITFSNGSHLEVMDRGVTYEGEIPNICFIDADFNSFEVSTLSIYDKRIDDFENFKENKEEVLSKVNHILDKKCVLTDGSEYFVQGESIDHRCVHYLIALLESVQELENTKKSFGGDIYTAIVIQNLHNMLGGKIARGFDESVVNRLLQVLKDYNIDQVFSLSETMSTAEVNSLDI